MAMPIGKMANRVKDHKNGRIYRRSCLSSLLERKVLSVLVLGCMLALYVIVPSHAIAQQVSAGTVLFSDEFTRDPNAVDPLSPWITALGTWTISSGVLQGSSSSYGSIYAYTSPLWTDYTVEGHIQFPAGSFGGGLGGRVNPATGARYCAWVYPDGSAGGPNALKLVKFSDWTTWSGTPMQQVTLPSVGTGWHTLKLAFHGNQIQVYYDGSLMVDVTDNNYDSQPPYSSGGISADFWRYNSPYSMAVDDVIVNAGYEITRWKGNKAGALSFTFDDGYDSQYSIGVPALNQLGFKGTFFLVTDFVSSSPTGWDNWRTAAGTGQEIGSHTKTHPYLTSLSFSGMQDEILGSKTIIDSQITSQKCISFAYPFGDLNGDVEGIVESAYIGARGVRWGLNSSPFDLFNMHVDFPDDADSRGVTLESQVDLAEQSGQWMIAGFHGLDGTGYGDVTADWFRQFIGYVNTKNLWVDTFGTVTKYIRERGSANLSIVSSSSGQLVLNLTDGLDNATYDQALTIRSAALPGCDTALVTQGRSSTTVTSILEGTSKVIYYNAVPDRGEITISCNSANLSPTAVNDTYNINVNTTLNQPAPGVLANDTDPEGATLTAQLMSGPSHGTLTINANGSFAYTPVANYAGIDSFTYTASDGTNNSNVATVTITVLPTLSSVTLSPTSVNGGSSSQGTVTISGPAPSGGAVVSLSSDTPSVAGAPASVAVPAGSTSATFTITTNAVSSSTLVTISAVYGGVTKTSSLTVIPPVLSTLTLSPTSVVGGNTSQGTVTISSPAPSSGVVVSLSDNSNAASVPASVTVPAGSTSVTFTVTTSTVTSSTSVTISAIYGGVTKTAALTVTPPPRLNSLSRSPSSVVGGNTAQGTVTLTGVAPSGGAVVPLSSSTPSVASVPESVTVPAGSTSTTFTITTYPVASSTSVTISAVYGGVTRTASLTVKPPALSTLTLSPTSVTGGSSSQGTVTLTGAAPSGGAVVSLSDNSNAASVPASITVPAGSTSATFTILTTAVNKKQGVTISAVYGGVTKKATLTVTP